MMATQLSRRSCALLRALSQLQNGQYVASLTTLPGILQRDSGVPYTPANISLPDSYSGQIQSAQGREHEFSKNRARDTVDHQGKSVEDVMVKNGETPQRTYDSEHYDDACNISLHSVMQSNVPEPYSRSPTHMNMPGSGIMQRQRFEGSRRVDVRSSLNSTNNKRNYHTSFRAYSQSPPAQYISEANFEPPALQGIQGLDDSCVTFKLWLENCHRYNLNCDEDLQGIQSGRKTLSQVFAQQDELIRIICKRGAAGKPTSGQGPQGNPEWH